MSGPHEDPLSARSVAQAIAPIMDRLRVSIARRVRPAAGDLLTEFDLDPQSAQTMSMLRNLLTGRSTTTGNVCAAFAYSAPDEIESSLASLTARSLITRDGDALALTHRGVELLTRLRAKVVSIIEELWDGFDVDELAVLAGRPVDGAVETGGAAFALLAPPFEPPGTSSRVLLAERVTPLRFHRYDAHAAAWRAAGLTAEEVRALPPGARRAQIEAATNDAAAAPYVALSRTERFRLCAGLGRLPN